MLKVSIREEILDKEKVERVINVDRKGKIDVHVNFLILQIVFKNVFLDMNIVDDYKDVDYNTNDRI